MCFRVGGAGVYRRFAIVVVDTHSEASRTRAVILLPELVVDVTIATRHLDDDEAVAVFLHLLEVDDWLVAANVNPKNHSSLFLQRSNAISVASACTRTYNTKPKRTTSRRAVPSSTTG